MAWLSPAISRSLDLGDVLLKTLLGAAVWAVAALPTRDGAPSGGNMVLHEHNQGVLFAVAVTKAGTN